MRKRLRRRERKAKKNTEETRRVSRRREQKVKNNEEDRRGKGIRGKGGGKRGSLK